MSSGEQTGLLLPEGMAINVATKPGHERVLS